MTTHDRRLASLIAQPLPDGLTPQETAIAAVRRYVERAREKTDPAYPPYDVYVVWFAYTLGNWKALLSTTLPDRHYYEVTHHVDGRTFLDAYVKIHNEQVTGPEAQAAVPAQASITEGPHTRACDWRAHPHGSQCHATCPTCHGREGFGG